MRFVRRGSGPADRGCFFERVEGRIAPKRKFFSYPVIGRFRAGVPQLASQATFETLNIEDVLVRDPNRHRFATCAATR